MSTGHRRKNSSIAETALLIEAINEMSLKLEENEKQKRRITSDVAHELRTPLTNLQTHMEAMIDGFGRQRQPGWKAVTRKF